MNYTAKTLIVTTALILCGCTQSNNKVTTASNPLKDSIAINTFMDFRLGSSRNETLHIIDSLIDAKQIEDYRTIKNKTDRFSWRYTAASVDMMKERHRFKGSIIAKGKSGQYNKYNAYVEFQFYNDSLYSVFVYPGGGCYSDILNNEEVHNMLIDKYSEHYTLKNIGPTILSDYYELEGLYAYWSPDEISKYTSYSANSRVWEFKTSTIGVSTLTYRYTHWEFDSNSYMRVIKNSSYADELDKMDEYDYARLSEEIISRAIIHHKENKSYDDVYFWYRNDIIQEQLDNIKTQEAERRRQYQLEQQKKREEESNKLKEQFGKQTI